jgi:glycosyltransferase AglD
MLRVYVPVYNEEKRIGSNVGAVEKCLAEAFGTEYELVVVDDSSKDRSLEIVKGLAAGNPKIKFKSFDDGPTRRENLAKAMLEAGDEDIVCFLDLDLSADLSRLPELVGYVASGYDVSVGSRYLGVSPKRDVRRLLISRLYNLMIRLLFSSKIRDHQCGFKAFRGKALKSLIAAAGYDSTHQRGWFWDAEILIRAQRGKYRINEFGVGWVEGSSSSFNIGRELRIIAYMLRFRLRR